MNDASIMATPSYVDPTPVRLNDLAVTPEYEPILRQAGLDSIQALFACSREGTLDKPGLADWRVRLRIVLPVGGGSRTLYVKRYDNPPARARRETARSGNGARSVAGVEWNWIRQLKRAGIPCVDGVAMGESFSGSRELRSVLITAEVPGEALERTARTWMGETTTHVRRLLPALADLVASLHRAGFVHRDLYLSHLFLDPDAPLEDALRLIDLQRVKRPEWNVVRWIIKDLAALNYATPTTVASRVDRVRWLKRYLQRNRLDADARRLVYRVVGKTQQIARHDVKRNARLKRELESP